MTTNKGMGRYLDVGHGSFVDVSYICCFAMQGIDCGVM